MAGTWGPRTRPTVLPLTGPARFKLADLEKATLPGGSPTARLPGAKQVWEQFPFDEQLVACEDKEWMWRVLSAGFSLYADPRLVVDSSHRRDAGLRSLYKRVHREHLVMAEMLDYPPLTVPGLLRKWWSEFPDGSSRPNWQRRLSPLRAAELTGWYTGDLAGTRRRRQRLNASRRALAQWAPRNDDLQPSEHDERFSRGVEHRGANEIVELSLERPKQTIVSAWT